jgi:D-glucosaminate-specific PTS system IIB component
MADIKLVRIDFRLMHGQVVVNWLKQVSANHILVIDADLSKDPFMCQVYKMAAPSGVKATITSPEDALEKIQSGGFKTSKFLVLFKSVSKAKKAFDMGFPISELQVGGLGSGTGRKAVVNQIFLDEKDAQDLVDMQAKGVKVYFQTVPKDEPISLEKGINNIF